MKKVLVLFGKSDWKRKNPFLKKIARQSYEKMYSLCEDNDIKMYRASYKWYDFNKNIFRFAWTFDRGEGWVRSYRFSPNLIYDKTPSSPEVYYKKEIISESYRFINNLLFTQLIDNKLTISLLFKEWTKESWLINSKNDLRKIIPKIKTGMIVIKPLDESEGKDVQILKKKSAISKSKIRAGQNYIAQEFIDSSRGVPGLNKNTHDLRVVIVDNKIIYSHIREPRKDSYLSNLTQGGSLSAVPLEKLPKSLRPIISFANSLFRTFSPCVYSIDFMFDRQRRPWIIELNSMPGLLIYPEKELMMKKMYKELTKVFRSF